MPKVLKLAHHLDMPKTEINHALLLAGFAPAYISRTPDDTELAPVKQAIAKLLDNHMPYPAIGLDRLWNIKMLNPSAAKMLSETGLSGHMNMLEALTAQTPEQSPLVNWDEAIGLLLEHLRAELRHRGHDLELQELVQNLAAHYNQYCHKPNMHKNGAVIPSRLQIGTQVISLFSTIVNFSTVQDIALGELKIELMFPMDDMTKAYFE